MNVGMALPVPGISPRKKPMRVPLAIGFAEWLQSVRFGKRSLTFVFVDTTTACLDDDPMFASTSLIPNRPMASKTMSKPSVRGRRPKVNRLPEVIGSNPTRLMMIPAQAMARLRATDPLVR